MNKIWIFIIIVIIIFAGIFLLIDLSDENNSDSQQKRVNEGESQNQDTIDDYSNLDSDEEVFNEIDKTIELYFNE